MEAENECGAYVINHCNFYGTFAHGIFITKIPKLFTMREKGTENVAVL